MELIAGLGVFFLGVKMLSDNVEKLANENIRALFNKTSKNKLAGVGIGTLVTALIQSSSMTTVLVVGFVNAGIMNLYQATTVIMGANIGTTITAHIAALQSFSISKIAMSLAGIGMIVSLFSKKENVKVTGNLIAGLGIIFVGLQLMSDSMSVIKQSETVTNLLISIRNPFLLFFIGICITAVLQSSSAVTSILISMVSAGIVIGNGGNEILYIILGTNIGTCVTALLSSIGTSINARRAAIIHLMFNVFGSIMFFIILLPWKSFMSMTFARWFEYPSMQVAMFHSFFNIVCTLLFLPFTKYFVKFSKMIIKDKKTIPEVSYLEKRFLHTPSVAISGVVNENIIIMDMAMNSLGIALDSFIRKNDSGTEKVYELNEKIEKKSKDITNYLIQLSSVSLSTEDETEVSKLHSNIGDIVRVAELADNIIKYTKREVREDLKFSETVKENLTDMYGKIKELAEVSKRVLLKKDIYSLITVDKLEDGIDEMRKELIADHITRLNSGECRAENSSVFINLVSNLERVGDHLTYIAHSIENNA